jgi:hypothetical protein
VYGHDGSESKTQCHRAHLTCNGISACEFFDSQLFDNCERYEPDEEAMRELWNHELDANEKEAGSVLAIVLRCDIIDMTTFLNSLKKYLFSRFYQRVTSASCSKECDGRVIVKQLKSVRTISTMLSYTNT